MTETKPASRGPEYICWALALLSIMPLAASVGSRMLYANAAENIEIALAADADEDDLPGLRAASASDARAADTTVADTTGATEPDQSLWARGRRAAFKRFTENGGPAIAAVLRIPQLETTIPVFKGATETAMTLGAGHLSDTAALTGDGNIALSSHRDGAFRILKDVNKGDAITLDTSAGVRTFIVKKLLIVEPSEVSVLAPTSTTTLTLITCHPFYFVGSAPKRYIVQAELTETITTTEQRQEI